MLIKSSIIKEGFQKKPLLSNATVSQKTKRVPVAYKGRHNNSNSAYAMLSRRQNNAEGTILALESVGFPQRRWLSRIKGVITENYTLDSIGGSGSFIYVIDSGIDVGRP